MNMVFDLGTSNFRAAITGNDEIIREPSVIAIDQSLGVIVGLKANAMVGRNPNTIDIVRPVQGGVIRNVEAAAKIIQYAARTLSPGRFGRKFSLSMAVPSQLTPVELRALEDAARLAGAKSVNFVNACVAAAIAAGLPVDGPNGCLVVNLGGGVTEVALLSMQGVVASRNVRTGGQAIDDAIVDRVRKDHSFHIGLRSAEALKHQFSDDSELGSHEVRGRDLKSGLPRSQVLSRQIIDDPITTYCDTIVDLICQVISDCPPELSGDIIEQGVLLCGGGANVQSLVNQLRSRIEPFILVPDDPEVSVIQGLCKSHPAGRRLGLTFGSRTVGRMKSNTNTSL